MRILNRFSVWLAIAGVTLAAWTVLTAGKQTPMPTAVGRTAAIPLRHDRRRHRHHRSHQRKRAHRTSHCRARDKVYRSVGDP